MNSIEQDIKSNLGKSHLPKYLAAKIRTKYELLRDRYGINFNSTVLTLKSSPDSYKQLVALPELSIFFRRNIDIWLEHHGSDNLVFSKSQNIWVRAARMPFRIALYNPESQKVESWSRIESISKWRKDHYLDAGSSKKSRFNGNLSCIQPIEFDAFNRGVCLLVKPDLMRIYLGFEKPIGKSTKGGPQKYICLECERVRRRQDTKAQHPEKVHGYKVKIHGYPVAVSDIDKDFKGTHLKHTIIPIVSG